MGIGTTVTYNGVTIQACQTNSFDETPIYDDSDTDLAYHKFNIKVTGTITGGSSSGHGATGALPLLSTYGDATPGLTAARIQGLLGVPRARFEMTLGDVTILEANGTAGAAISETGDVNNGPKPRAVRLTHIVSDKLIRVEFEIEICLLRCTGNPPAELQKGLLGNIDDRPANAKVLYNRWSVTETRDDSLYATLQWEGKLRLRSSSAVPNDFRYLVVPPLLAGYQRVAIRFSQQPDALTLNYAITDKQRYAAPPFPAAKWSCTHTESTGRGGTVVYSEVSVRLDGLPGAHPFQLLLRAFQVAETRLGGFASTLNLTGSFVESASFTEFLHDNSVEMRMRVMRIIGGPGGPALFLKSIAASTGKKLNEPTDIGAPHLGEDYDHTKFPLPPLNVTPFAAWATALKNTCSNRVPTPVASGYSTPPAITTPVTPVVIEDPGGTNYEKPTGTGLLKSETAIIFSEVSSAYYTSHGRVVMPTLGIDNDQSIHVVDIHEPVTYRVLSVQVESINDWPKIPPPADTHTGPNDEIETLISSEVVPSGPVATAAGHSLLYKLSCQYKYVLSKPIGVASNIRSGIDPALIAHDGSYSPGTKHTAKAADIYQSDQAPSGSSGT